MLKQSTKYALAAAGTLVVGMLACTPTGGAPGAPGAPGASGAPGAPGATAAPTGGSGVTTSETALCMTCHGDKTELGNKLQNARDQWSWSVHAKGLQVPIQDSSGNVLGWEFEGSDGFYGQANGCQVCHTKEGFNKGISGEYPSLPEYSFPHYQSGAATSDTTVYPSSITCFTCHKPHTNKNFDLVYPASKSVKMFSGAEYKKPEGSICVGCHQSRIAIGTAEALSISAIKSGMSFRHGPHYSGQSDMLMGKGGAEYAGKTYGNGMHTTLDGANCVACHMTRPTGSGWSPNIGGHSFNVTGIIHGAQKGNVAGCVTCHSDKSGTAYKMKAPLVGDSGTGIIQPKGFLKKGKAYFTLGTKTVEHYNTINDLAMTLVNPDDSFKGLLLSAYQLPDLAGATGTITIGTDFHPTAINFNLKEATASATTRRVRFAKAYYNYLFFLYDGSYGVHNPKYLSQLLHDSCTDLKDLLQTSTPSATSSADCGTRP